MRSPCRWDGPRAEALRGRREAGSTSAPWTTSDVDPPPSRFSASRAPSRAIRRASSASVRPASVVRAAVDSNGDRHPTAEAERRARVTAVGDVGVELILPRGEVLGVDPGRYDRLAEAHQKRPGLEEVAARCRRQLAAWRDARDAPVDVEARAPGRGERLAPPRDPVRTELTERHAVRPCVEPADEGVIDRVGPAPVGKRARWVEGDHAERRAGERKLRDVHHGARGHAVSVGTPGTAAV